MLGGSTTASSYTSSSLYYGGGNVKNNGSGGSGNNSINGRLSLESNLGLRKRDAVAIFTCLFLLRLAFSPGGGLINLSGSTSSISASMELAFYSSFQSIPPKIKDGTFYNGNERTARPVPLDIDGDGVVESMVVPVFLTRNEVVKEKEGEMTMLQKKNKRKFSTTLLQQQQKKDKDDNYGIDGWSEDGSWGMRILDLRSLYHKSERDTEGIVAGPFAPRTLFLSPLFPFASSSSSVMKQEEEEENGEGGGESLMSAHKKKMMQGTNSSPDMYPVKVISIQIPIQRTHLGEEEKSRQRHKKEAGSGSSSSYGKNSAIPPKDHANDNYDRTRHYFCGKEWHHASESCHKHCPGGLSSECSDGETCYADTPCDVHIEPDSTSNDNSNDNKESATKMALTKSGTLPGIATVWSDGSVSLHVITADVTPSAIGSDGHRTKRAKQKNIKPDLELRQLWRVYPLQPKSEEIGRIQADFVELGITFESGTIYSSVDNINSNEKGKKRFGDSGAIILGGRYTLLTTTKQYPVRVSFHALDVLTGTSLWDLKGNHKAKDDQNKKELPPKPIVIHTTSSARRRSHLPTSDVLDTEFENDNAFIEGDDVMTSEECMSHFRASVLDSESGALPHEFWDNGELGTISVSRFDRSKRFGGKRLKALGKKGLNLLKNKGKSEGDGRPTTVLPGSALGQGRRAVGSKAGGRNSANRGGGSWQTDLIQRAIPKRLINQQRYKSKHPNLGKPNVILFHGSDGLAVLSLKNGRPVCHISLMDHSLYVDMDADGAIDTVQVVTTPATSTSTSGVQSLIHRIAKEQADNSAMNTPTICHALVTSGLPPREEVFTAPLCLGGPINPSRSHLIAAPPLLLEGSLGYGLDVVFAMNNGVVVRYDFNGREVWRKKGGLKDGTPTWISGKTAFLGRVQFLSVHEKHSSVSASSHRNQHRPGSPVRPILLSGEDGAALISPASGKVLASVIYPQSVSAQPLLADMNGDGTDDLLVVSKDAIWGYVVATDFRGRSGGFVLVVISLVIGVAISCLINKATGNNGKRSTDA